MSTVRSAINNPNTQVEILSSQAPSSTKNSDDLPTDVRHSKELVARINSSQESIDSASNDVFPIVFEAKALSADLFDPTNTDLQSLSLDTSFVARSLLNSSKRGTPRSDPVTPCSTRSTSTQGSFSSADQGAHEAMILAMHDLATTYGLSENQRTSLQKLIPLTNADHLEDLFKEILAKKFPNNQLTTVLRTLGKVADAYEASLQTESPTYVKKGFAQGITHTHTFIITQDKQLILTQELYASGANKKVNTTTNLTTGQSLVRLVASSLQIDNYQQISHNDQVIAATESELELHAQLAAGNPDIQQPHHIAPIKRSTSSVDGKTGAPQIQGEKLVFFNIKMEKGSALNLDPNNLPQIYTAAMCMLRGLNRMHEQGYVHLDMKPHNLLIKDESGVVKIIDFGITKEIGKPNKSGTPGYVDPAVIATAAKKETIFARPENDAYAAGHTLLDFISVGEFDDRFQKRPEKFFNQLDAGLQQMAFVELRREIKQNKKLSAEEKELRLEFVIVAQKLMDPDLSKRFTCAQAFDALSKIAIKHGIPIPDLNQ